LNDAIPKLLDSPVQQLLNWDSRPEIKLRQAAANRVGILSWRSPALCHMRQGVVKHNSETVFPTPPVIPVWK
jgi:hypothetical protein